MHGFDRLPRQDSARNVGLVGDDDADQPQRSSRLQRLADPGQDVELLHGLRGKRFAAANKGAAHHPVPIQEESRTPGHRRPSHLVLAAFSLGCDTNRCQTTA